MLINYDGKRFRPLQNSVNGEVSDEMIFHYYQTEHIVSCSYQGVNIVQGHLIGIVSEKGIIDMRYQQVNRDGQLMTGQCRSTPEIMTDGRIRLHEKWRWTSGDQSSGESVLEEID